jgi:hypothetical protein
VTFFTAEASTATGAATATGAGTDAVVDFLVDIDLELISFQTMLIIYQKNRVNFFGKFRKKILK